MSAFDSTEYAKRFNWGYLIADDNPKLGQQLAMALVNGGRMEDGLLDGLLAGLSSYEGFRGSFSEILTSLQLLTGTQSERL
jgi:hypothetical protein